MSTTDTGTSASEVTPIDRSTPEGTVRQLWRLYQSQNLPGIVAMYDPKAVKVMGKETVAGAIRSQTSPFQAGQETIESVEAAESGEALVSWKREVPDSEPVFGSYRLIDGGKRGWIVEYDSTLSTGVYVYTLGEKQRQLNPKKDPASASPEATAAAVEAQNKYDSAFGTGSAEEPTN